jgi:molybdopterin-guanine dinucleotide biosynthesis protein MobB
MGNLWSNPPVLGFAAFSGSGKTTLVAGVLPLLLEHQLRIGVIKHSHHDFEIDQPGKDSHRLRMAGASQTLIASPWRTAWIRESRQAREPQLQELLLTMQRDTLDLILVEGFRHEAFPKIEIHRSSMAKPLLYRQDPHIIALVCDQPVDTPLPILDIDNLQQVADFIFRYTRTVSTGASP